MLQIASTSSTTRRPAWPPVLWFVQITLLCAWSALVSADQLPEPTGPVILTISGDIEHANSRSEHQEPLIEFDLPMLEALNDTRFSTATPWTEGQPVWEGISIEKLLEFAGARSQHLKIHALDDYAVTIDDFDFGEYPVVLANRQNGKHMSIRNLGPLWIMFPFDNYPELLTEVNKSRAVWQVFRIEVL